MTHPKKMSVDMWIGRKTGRRSFLFWGGKNPPRLIPGTGWKYWSREYLWSCCSLALRRKFPGLTRCVPCDSVRKVRITLEVIE